MANTKRNENWIDFLEYVALADRCMQETEESHHVLDDFVLSSRESSIVLTIGIVHT